MNNQPPLPGQPFLEWCGNPASATIVNVRLNTVAVQQSLPLNQQPLIEPAFPGYLPANNFAWAVRRLLPPAAGYAQSGLLNWVCENDNSSPAVQGYAVTIMVGELIQILAVQNLKSPKLMTRRGDTLSLVVILQQAIYKLIG